MNANGYCDSATWRRIKLRTLFLLLGLLALGFTVRQPTAQAQTTAEDASTFFIAAQGEGMEQEGDWWVQSFTVYRPTRFFFRFTSDYAAQAAIIAPDYLESFQNFESFSGFGLFDNQFGTKIVDLRPGQYYVAVRNLVDGFNTFSVELDYPLNLSNSMTASYVFNDYYVQGSSYVDPDGGVFYQAFTVQNGFRYFLDGCNSGLDTLIIPSADFQSFLDGDDFRYYTAYSGSSPGLPGLYELRLPPGNYHLVFENLDEIDHSATYTMERWRVIPTASANTGLKLYAPASWQVISPNSVRLSVQKIANNSRTRTSGTLKLELWALTTPFNGGTAYGTRMAEHRLPKMLAPGYYFQNFTQNAAFIPPAAGRRYTALFLTEWNGSTYVIRDYLNFAGPTSFSQTRALISNSSASSKSVAKSGTSEASDVKFSLGTASASTGSIVLKFAGALEPVSAGDASHYTVVVDGRSLTVESAAYDARSNSVTLSLPQDTLQTGDTVTVRWNGLRDASGKPLTGQANVTAR